MSFALKSGPHSVSCAVLTFIPHPDQFRDIRHIIQDIGSVPERKRHPETGQKQTGAGNPARIRRTRIPGRRWTGMPRTGRTGGPCRSAYAGRSQRYRAGNKRYEPSPF